MDRPIVGSEGFLKVTLGNVVTLIGAVGAFAGLLISSAITTGKYQEKFDNQDKRLSHIEDSLSSIANNFNDQKLDIAEIKRDVKGIQDNDVSRDKRFDNDESRIKQVEDVNQTLSTNVQLINQQLNFLSVSKSFIQPDATPKKEYPSRR